MEKRTIIAFVLSFVILVVWSVFFGPKPSEKPQTPVAEQGESLPQPQTAPPPTGTAERSLGTPAPPPQASQRVVGEKEIRVETRYYQAVFSNVGPTIKSFKLKDYRLSTETEAPLIELVSLKPGMGPFLQVDFGNPGGGPGNLQPCQVIPERRQIAPVNGPETLTFQAQQPDGTTIVRTFRFHPDQYRIDLSVRLVNTSNQPLQGALTATLRALPPAKKGYYSYVGLVTLTDEDLEKMKADKPGETKSVQGQIAWVAYEDDYFISALIPESRVKARFRGERLASGILKGTYAPDPVTLHPGQEMGAAYSLYFGPRDLGVLKDLGRDLDRAVDFGWTNVIAKPLLYVLRFFNQYLHNYGISIILLTILVKLLFWPLTHKSYKSMKEMKKLQPRLTKIREKYKDNREMMNKEMMALYRTYKVNPMGGCLPMVIQIPVFFALFRILGNAIELRHAPFVLWINDLSAPDRLFRFPFKIPFMAEPYGIPVLTLLMGASMFLQQKMTPTPGDPAQAKIMLLLPIIFTFMFINFPSGLVLYWLVNNLLSIGQQYRIQKGAA